MRDIIYNYFKTKSREQNVSVPLSDYSLIKIKFKSADLRNNNLYTRERFYKNGLRRRPRGNIPKVINVKEQDIFLNDPLDK